MEKVNKLDGLMKKCIQATDGNVAEGMKNLQEAAAKFEKWAGPATSPLKYAKELTGFMHRGLEVPFNSAYKESKLIGDTSPFSINHVSENINYGNSKVGDCLGTTQVGAYLLASQGIDSIVIEPNRHILVGARINDEWKAIETTASDGFDELGDKPYKTAPIKELEPILLTNLAIYYKAWGSPKRAIKHLSKAIDADPNYESAYYSRGLENYTRNPGESLKDFVKYSEFSKKNHDEVLFFMTALRSYLPELKETE